LVRWKNKRNKRNDHKKFRAWVIKNDGQLKKRKKCTLIWILKVNRKPINW